MVITPGVIVLIEDAVLAGDMDDVVDELELQAATNALSKARAIPARIETDDRGIPTTLLHLGADRRYNQ